MMKRTPLIALAILFSGMMTFAQAPVKPSKKDTTKTKTIKTAKVVYTCSMHPEISSDKPGKCPKCGMTLVKKEAAKKGTMKM